MNNGNEIKIGFLQLLRPKRRDNYNLIYLADTGEKFSQRFGRLGVLINFKLSPAASSQNLIDIKDKSQQFVSALKESYYNPLNTTSDIEKDFEALLGQTNKWLSQEKNRNADLFAEAVVNIDINIILIHNNTILFSQIGDIQTYLVQGDKPSPLVDDKTKNKSIKFANVISGTLEKGDVLLFATPSLFDYFTKEKIVQIIKASPPEQSIKILKQLLGEELKRINLLVLIIGRPVRPATAETRNKAEAQKDSESQKISEIQRPQEPEKTLAPEEKPELEEKIETIITEKPKDALTQKVRIESEEEEMENMPPIKQLPSRRPLTKVHYNIFNFIKSRPLIKIGTLNRRKSLILLLIILGIFFAASLTVLGCREWKIRSNRNYNQLVETLKTKEFDLSLAVMYKDEAKIRQTLAEIKTLLDKLPQKTDQQKSTYQLFYDKYNQELNKLYRLIVLDKPNVLIDLTDINKNIHPDGMANLSNNFYIFDSTNNYIYLFNNQTKKTELVNETSLNVGRIIKLFPMDNDNLIGYDDNNGIVIFNTIDKKLLPAKLEAAQKKNKIEDLSFYGRRLYLLAPADNQIFKYSQTIDGFGKEEAWVQEKNVNISDGLALTLDGSAYILKKTGQIFKFYKGARVTFNLDDIQPALSNQGAIKLFTDINLKYLYLLDGSSKRLIVLDKNGRLLKQFTSPEFVDLKDFIVNKREDTAWLLAGTKIFEVELK